MKISVVIPVYGCPEALEPLHKRLTNALKVLTNNYEIILVNDSCPYGSWDKIETICENDRKVIGINLVRNFGQVHATNAGLNYATGDYVVVMDCDLQDRPEGINILYSEIIKGYDIVFSRRANRKDSKLTILLSKMFYSVYSYFIDEKFDGTIGNLCIVSRKVINEYKKIDDNNKIFINYLFWMGFKSSVVEIEGDERYQGESSYSFRKKINLAIDTITSQSNKPLKILINIGFCIAFLSFIFLSMQIVRYFINKNINEGWTSIIASIFFMGGLTLMCLGCIGIYVGNIFDQTRDKPEFIIDNIINGRIMEKQNRK